MARAVCARCGVAKSAWSDPCDACAFSPWTEGTEAQVLSILLSVSRFETARERREYQKDLDDLGARLKRGERLDFSPEECSRIEAFVTEGKGWRTRDTLEMYGRLVLWLGVPIVIMIGVIVLLSSC